MVQANSISFESLLGRERPINHKLLAQQRESMCGLQCRLEDYRACHVFAILRRGLTLFDANNKERIDDMALSPSLIFTAKRRKVGLPFVAFEVKVHHLSKAAQHQSLQTSFQ